VRLAEPGDERGGLGPGAVPDEDAGDGRERGQVRLREVGRERAGAREREDLRRAGPGGEEEGGGERGDGGRAAQRERGAVDRGERDPRGGAEEGDGGVHGREARRVGREGGDGLEREVGEGRVRAPGGHEEERGRRPRRGEREGDALRALDAGGEVRVGEPRAEVRDQGREGEQRVERRRVDVDERVRWLGRHACSALLRSAPLRLRFAGAVVDRRFADALWLGTGKG